MAVVILGMDLAAATKAIIQTSTVRAMEGITKMKVRPALHPPSILEDLTGNALPHQKPFVEG